MRCIECTESGGADVLRLSATDTPSADPGEVLIRVQYSGINRADILQRQGFYPPPPGASPLLGLEVSGEIAALGGGVPDWRVGDRVCALLAGGGYAEYAVARASECLPAPAEISAAAAASLPETVLTVWANAVERAGLRPGQSFLVHGGTSGIGTMAIQLARLLGCETYATAGSDEKVAACLDLGADLAINYRREDFVERLLEHTGGRGVDVILDMVGGDYVQKNILLASTEGCIVNIACLRGAKVELDMMAVMRKRLRLTGSTLRARDAQFKRTLVRSVREKVWPWVVDGRLKAVIHEIYPAGSVAQAHRTMESSRHIGKLLLNWDQPMSAPR